MKISVRLLREEDLTAADHIFRLAFGTFAGHPDPEKFGGDIDKIRTRWRVHRRGVAVRGASGE
jgi:hypothetical protein